MVWYFRRHTTTRRRRLGPVRNNNCRRVYRIVQTQAAIHVKIAAWGYGRILFVEISRRTARPYRDVPPYRSPERENALREFRPADWRDCLANELSGPENH